MNRIRFTFRIFLFITGILLYGLLEISHAMMALFEHKPAAAIMPRLKIGTIVELLVTPNIILKTL